jgi:hypothetical protein
MIDYTKNFHYLDLKPIPESLYSDIWHDLNNPTLSDLPMDKYQISDVNDRLKDCMHDIFNGTGYQFDCVNVQRISKDLKWHIDGRRISVCNFLIQPGGENVKTLFPDEELVIEPFRWHHLNVQRWHRVINLSQPPRLAICVFKEVRRPHDVKLPDFPTPYIN